MDHVIFDKMHFNVVLCLGGWDGHVYIFFFCEKSLQGLLYYSMELLHADFLVARLV